MKKTNVLLLLIAIALTGWAPDVEAEDPDYRYYIKMTVQVRDADGNEVYADKDAYMYRTNLTVPDEEHFLGWFHTNHFWTIYTTDPLPEEMDLEDWYWRSTAVGNGVNSEIVTGYDWRTHTHMP